MAAYRVLFKPSVEKDLGKLSKDLVSRVLKRIEMLLEQPYPKQAAKLEGAEALYRLRVGDYRIIYSVDTRHRRIMIHYVRHRREVYRNFD